MMLFIFKYFARKLPFNMNNICIFMLNCIHKTDKEFQKRECKMLRVCGTFNLKFLLCVIRRIPLWLVESHTKAYFELYSCIYVNIFIRLKCALLRQPIRQLPLKSCHKMLPTRWGKQRTGRKLFLELGKAIRPTLKEPNRTGRVIK